MCKFNNSSKSKALLCTVYNFHLVFLRTDSLALSSDFQVLYCSFLPAECSPQIKDRLVDKSHMTGSSIASEVLMPRLTKASGVAMFSALLKQSLREADIKENPVKSRFLQIGGRGVSGTTRSRFFTCRSKCKSRF